jgi:hypothetical protein
MDNLKHGGFATPTEQRKQLLIAQGAMFRSGVVVSREAVKHSLRADTLAKNVLKQIGLAAFSNLRGPSGLLSNLPTLAPLLFGGISSLWRKPKWKPLVRGAVVAGVVAAAVAIVVKKKKTRAEADAEEE